MHSRKYFSLTVIILILLGCSSEKQESGEQSEQLSEKIASQEIQQFSNSAKGRIELSRYTLSVKQIENIAIIGHITH
ncbi:MAG: PBP1b-binding outer membrane lipoprotein LpoB, partial [Cyclobacteriaceae bacterium]